MPEVPGSIPVAGEELSEHASLSFVSFAGMTWTHCIGILIGKLTGGPVTQEIQLFEGRFLSILAFTAKTGQSLARITHIFYSSIGYL